MSIGLQFMGAARHVTGSKHLLTVGDRRVLLDCGMVQGPRRIANQLNRTLPFEAGGIDAVVLSHAHVDHSGSLPLLVKLGFRREIYCTEATQDLLGILLPDSAKLQAADARHLAKHGHEYEPPYDMSDVERTLARVRGLRYHQTFDVCPGVRATFIDAGHILGSAHVILDVEDAGERMRIVFTGDHGRRDMPILRDPEPLPRCDVLITESTYGDRLHPPVEDLIEQIVDFVKEQRARAGGRLLIPAFSVGRTQNILWYLGRLMDEGALARVPIWLDSPMSTKATSITARHRELFDEEARAVIDHGRDPFLFEGVQCVASIDQSKALNSVRRGIIISASGMCEGGRILHHLKNTVGRPEDSVLLVGYMARSTLGRRLLEGYEWVRIFGERHRVRCRVHHINGLSAHADWKEMLDHFAPIVDSVKRVFVVHGEEDPALKFADRLIDAGFAGVEVPVNKQSYELA